MSTVYLNGEYLPKDQARISPDDRGFLLSDGIYEVTSFYEGVPLGLDRHMDRLRSGLRELRIDFDTSGVEAMHHRLIEENDLGSAETSLVYLQITRGAAPRTHYFPTEPVEPTVYAFAKAWNRPSPDDWNRGFTAVTVPDRRWMRVDIKTISLLPNVLAFQQARDAGVDDAILVRDGVAIEGAHQNFWAVFGDMAVTHPTTNLILPGISRGLVLEIAGERGIPTEQRAITVEELADADEAFFTGTTGEVRPCVQIDGRAVGDGSVGPVTRALSDGFRDVIARVQRDAAVGAGAG